MLDCIQRSVLMSFVARVEAPEAFPAQPSLRLYPSGHAGELRAERLGQEDRADGG